LISTLRDELSNFTWTELAGPALTSFTEYPEAGDHADNAMRSPMHRAVAEPPAVLTERAIVNA